MMGNYGGMMGGAGLFGLLTWLLLIAFLALGCIFFWQRINKK
jgi:hypothetical protein